VCACVCVCGGGGGTLSIFHRCNPLVGALLIHPLALLEAPPAVLIEAPLVGVPTTAIACDGRLPLDSRCSGGLVRPQVRDNGVAGCGV
jgi:hypothetical protein